MKKILFIGYLLAFLPSHALAQLPANFSYGKYLTGVEDQLLQGPCESFAAVGGVEAFYNLRYRGWGLTVPAIDLSEREPYTCGGGQPTIGLDNVLRYIGDHGVIPRSCFPMPTGPLPTRPQPTGEVCTPNLSDNSFDPPFIRDKERNCPAAQIACSLKYRIKAPSRRLTTEMTTNDGIKQALLTYGPIMVYFDDGGAIHGGYHGYLLYGWYNQNGTTYWWLRDSWPCVEGHISSNINLAAIFASGTNHQAHVITSVTKENWNGNAWQPQTQTILPFELEQGNQSARIVPPANSCLNQGQYSVAGTLPAGSSITGWSVRAPSYNYYSDATISSTGVLSGNGADVTVIATLRRANGLLENITLPVSTVGIPHAVETNSYCSYSYQREIDLRLNTRFMAGYSYTQAINIPPSPDGSYYTTGNGSWSVHLVSRKTQAITYGTTVTATQSGNPACSKTITVSNRHVVAMPCSYY